ncbi:MAG: arginase [Ardenticatenaceae bacterium]|nr:arginase [Ardenticatenaceae bacterium]HBY95241.1 arginase [Chloroflexota bacterium]
MNRAISINGVPMDLGQGRRGVDMGPGAIRYAGLNARLAGLGFDVNDKGNLDVPVPEEQQSAITGGTKYLSEVSTVNRELADRTAQTLQEGAIPITLGGDHSIAAGSIVGVRRQERVGVLWIDAHGDFNTPESSPSGNLHGMPLAALLGREPQVMAPWEGSERLRPQEVVLVGIRSLDRDERRALVEYGPKVYTMRDVDELGIAEVTRRALCHFSRLGLPRLHVSLDLDVLDPSIAPGVGTPVPGGLSYREAHLLMEILSDDERVGSLDVVEINPILDVRNGTAELAVELVASLLGQSII